MKATTVKLDGDLLDQIEKAKAPGQSVTAYVRSVLRKNLEQQRLREASVAYRAFIEAHPDEREWLGEWERADLPTAPSDQRDAQ